ncbi:MAG: hypothetical protein LPK19_05065 [Hymenobacteraceae bacterium]|nr:hypothetical protein [Hymenobacteraceae bacterium]MDX5395569.1 hypothetical protein [Hymenobacteraceae bacterium]MDX5511621.1 hypothetical protein [Hymenobacteraceae bacterium]
MEDKEELTTMVKIVAQLRKEGYTYDFKVSDDGYLCTTHENHKFTPDQVKIVNFYRFEGESNPGDMAILYVIESESGIRGTISDAYGTYYDERTEEFMKQVTDLGKDIDKQNYKR